jgi:hypothetical protein
VVDSSHVVGCGWYYAYDAVTLITTYSAAIYRVGNDGTFKWFYLLEPVSGTNTTKTNACYGLAYHEETQRITTLIHSNSDYLSYSNNYDLALVTFDKTG